MAFLAPGWLALLLLGLPIILLHRRRARPKPHPVGNLFIWRRVLEQRPARPQRPIPSLLLFLQLAALVAGSLALAQPVLVARTGEARPVHVVLDGSASMRAPTPEGDRFQSALEELSFHTARYPDASYTLIFAQGLHPRVVARNVDRATLLHEAGRLAPHLAPVDWGQVSQLLTSLPGPLEQVWLVGDGQGDAVGTLIAGLEAAGREVPVSLVSTGEPLPNLGVTAFSARPTGTSLDRYAILVEVSNASDQMTLVRLTVTLEPLAAGAGQPGRILIDRWVEAAARGVLQVQEELTLPSDGLWALKARIDPRDPFPADDEASLAILPPRPTLVYLASQRGDPWLRALRALPEVAVTWRQTLPSQPPEGYDLVIYDGYLPARLPDSTSVVLPPQRGAESGRPSEREMARPFVPDGTATTLPWALFFDEGRTEGVRPSWWEEDDPLFQFVDWSEAELRGVRPVRAQPGVRVLMESPAGPLMARLDQPPALLVGFDPGQGRLPSQPGFPVWVANLVRWANPQAWNRVAPAVSPGEVLRPPGSGKLVNLAGEEVAAGPWQVDRPGIFTFVPDDPAMERTGMAPWIRATEPLPRWETDLTDVAPALWSEPPVEAGARSGMVEHDLTRSAIILLAILLLVELLLWMNQEAMGRRFTTRRLPGWWPAAAARLVVLALVAAAAAGVTRWIAGDLNELWIVLDRSRSVDARLQDEAWRWVQELRVEAAERRVGVALFGAHPAVERSPEEAGPLPPVPLAEVNPYETDVEAALRLVVSQMQPPARLILVTDGYATRGEAGLVLDRLRELGSPVDVVPLVQEGPPDVAIEQLRVRPQVDPGAPYLVRVALRAGQPAPARLVLRAAGIPVAERRVDLPAGSSSFDLAARAPENPSILPLEVTVEAPGDERPENNRAEAALRVGDPPAMVVVHQGTSRVAPLLEAQGLRAAAVTPGELPTDPAFWGSLSGLVLEGVPATALTQEQRRSIVHLVRDLGGGLLVVGGPQAYSAGGYQGTELEEILPVSLSLPLDLLVPRVAMVLVIDRSGSMGEHQGQRTKLDLAKQASLGLLDNLSSDDSLGILAFDTQPTWVVPLGRVGTGAGVLQRLAQLSPSGGTNLGPALDQAVTALEAVPAVVKHILILSDGKSTPGPFIERARAAARASITLSTVAIGRDADRSLLEALAREGGGRHYYTDDVERLPEIFLREVRAVTAPQVLMGPHPVEVREREPFLTGGTVPSDLLDRLNAAGPREGATVHVATRSGRPVLASWNYGLGRVVAFLSQPTAGWAGPWGEVPALWSQMTRWLLPPPTGLQASSSLEITTGTGTLTLDLLDLEGGYVNFAPLEATIQDPSGVTRRLGLEQIAPGRYQAVFPATLPGAYLATVRRTDQPGAVPVATVSSWVAAAPELELHPRPDPALYELARATGGRVLSLDDGFERLWEATPGARIPRSLRRPLLVAALAFFLVDLILRLRPVWRPRGRTTAGSPGS